MVKISIIKFSFNLKCCIHYILIFIQVIVYNVTGYNCRKKVYIFILFDYRLDLNAADSGVQQKILQCETNPNVEKDKSCMQC